MNSQSAEFFRSVLSSIADLVIVTDIHWTVVHVNPPLNNMLGYSADEFLGKDLRNLLSDAGSGMVSQIFSPKNEEDELQPARIIESSLVRKNGSVFCGEVSVQNLRSIDGTIHGTILQIRDISERNKREDELIRGALYDTMTGLPNRGLFKDRVHRIFARTRRFENRVFAVVYLDIDRFKFVNDSFGHDIGDQVLIAAARRIESCLRPGDTVARLGGDEYGIIIDDVSEASGAHHITSRILEELGQPLRINGLDIRITASAGITIYTLSYSNPEDLIRNADAAMYRAKQHGRARLEIFDQAMRDQAIKRMDLEADLRLALDRREFRIYYHPIVALSDMKIVGVEALLRWQHPKRGIVSAGEFLSLAEETGLILPIGEWILRQVLMHQKSWKYRMSVALNISAAQFDNREFFESFTRTLRDEQADSNLIRIDVTEKTLMKDIDYTINVLNALNALGIQILIDDFGTGSSSLGYLKRFPVTALKIDRSFISEIPDDTDFAKVVKAAIIMAHTLGLNISAEGVENEAQIEFLKIFECDEAQGYHFCKPMPAEDFADLLETAPHSFREA